MNRALLIALAAVALAGCSNDPASHHGSPPKDPADYHGVPTDDRPPSMLDTPDTSRPASSSQAVPQ